MDSMVHSSCLPAGKAGFMVDGLLSDSLIAAVSNRSCGNMSLRWGDSKDSLSNRRKFLESVGINYQDLVCAKQIHSDNIAYITEKDKTRGALSYDTAIANTDALVTDKKNIPLAVFTADCLSVFLYDATTPAIGVVHAGWRSTKDDISAKTARFMRDKFGTPLERLIVSFGPCIRSCCYEVSREFNDCFTEDLVKKGDSLYLDLVKVNKKQLMDLSVDEKNIFDCKVCTFCAGKDYFSFRKEHDKAGRMMSVAMLK